MWINMYANNNKWMNMVCAYIHMFCCLWKRYQELNLVQKFLWSFEQRYTHIIGHYNPPVWIIDLVSHTAYVVCVNFIHKRRDLQFKVDSERQIFWETFHGNFIYSPARNLLRGNRRKKYFSYFVLMSGLGLEPWLFV